VYVENVEIIVTSGSCTLPFKICFVYEIHVTRPLTVIIMATVYHVYVSVVECSLREAILTICFFNNFLFRFP
jgi:hypothetical protein